MPEYVFPIAIGSVPKFPIGKRIVKDVREGNRVALVTIEVDASEL
jgi:hypothetical protein